MAEPKEQKQEQEQETAIATRDEQGLVTGFDLENDPVLAGIASDIESTLKQISVTEFTGARGFIDKPLTLLDAFPFTMQEESQVDKGQTVDVGKVIFTVADEHGEVHNVMQNSNASRERFVKLYDQVKAANIAAKQNKQLALTNVTFREVGKPNFGNRPIILTVTPETRQVWSAA